MTRLVRLSTLFVSVAAAIGLVATLVWADDSTAERAGQALGPFKRALKQALTEGMAEGPVAAIGACNTKAPGIAEAHSQSGVKVGRASHRLRNPANVAPDWVQPILDAYLADEANRAPRSVELSGDRSGYVEPLLVQPLCVTCHGATLAPDVAARIAELYPDDQATGFDVGDLRGVWWVELPAAAPR